jgi:hypothetical protein
MLGEDRSVRRWVVMVKQPGLFSLKVGATSSHVFTQSPQNIAVEPRIPSLACWNRCFALPQLLYRWLNQSGIFWIPPRMCTQNSKLKIFEGIDGTLFSILCHHFTGWTMDITKVLSEFQDFRSRPRNSNYDIRNNCALHHHGMSTKPLGYVLFPCWSEGSQIKVVTITNPEYLEHISYKAHFIPILFNPRKFSLSPNFNKKTWLTLKIKMTRTLSI